MTVIIGVDPHKASHTAVAISDGEEELDRKRVRSGCSQLSQLVSWAEQFSARTCAIESASGLGYLLAQQLVAAGETVVDVPAVSPPYRPKWAKTTSRPRASPAMELRTGVCQVELSAKSRVRASMSAALNAS